MFVQTQNQPLNPTPRRIIDTHASYHYEMPPPRKKPRISVLKRGTCAMRYHSKQINFQKPRKTVRFDTSVKDHQIQKAGQRQKGTSVNATRCPRGKIVSTEEIKNLWYDRSDLMGFRQQVISLFHHISSNGDENSLPRGMESMSTKRRRHKVNTLRFIVLAHRTGKDQDYLARLCAKLGCWNKEIAIRDAWLAYFEIYQPSFVQRVPPVLTKPPKITFVVEPIVKTNTCSQPRTCESPLTSSSSKKRKHS